MVKKTQLYKIIKGRTNNIWCSEFC